MSTGGDSGGDDSLGDGRKGGKRELSQSKRAAQNRAAQVCESAGVLFPLFDGDVYFLKWELFVKSLLAFLLCQFSCHPSHDSSLRNPSEPFDSAKRDISRSSRSRSARCTRWRRTTRPYSPRTIR